MVSSHAGYVAIATTESEVGEGPSRSTSVSSSPLQSSNATLYPAGGSADRPYSISISEKSGGWSSQQQQQLLQQFGTAAIRPKKRLLSERAMRWMHRTKTTVLVCICLLLAGTVWLQSHGRLPAPAVDAATKPATRPSASALTDADLSAAPRYRLEDDMVLITKVGSATAHKRLLIHLAEQPRSNLYMPNHLYVSDYALTVNNVTFYDALANVSSTIARLDEFRALRGELRALIESNQDLDDFSTKDAGWKLDKYKFLPAFAEAYRRWPGKKWYVMVEADTFLFWNQLVRWLVTLDAEQQLMMGHPSFCDYDDKSIMFTHGGSGIVLSKAVMQASFGQDADFEHSHDDLIQKSAFGDALLSKSLYDSPNVTLTELSPQGGEKFNSDPPRVVKFSRGNWCSPLMSFHHVTPTDTAHLYDFQRRIESRLNSTDLVRWADVWDEFIPAFLKEAMDQVGQSNRVAPPPSNTTTISSRSTDAEPGEVGVIGWQAIQDWDSETTDLFTSTAEDCQTQCRQSKDCLMWEWRRAKTRSGTDWPGRNRKRAGATMGGKCRFTSDFLRIGVTKPNAEDGLTTGWMGKRIDAWRKRFECSGRTGLNAY